MLENTFARSDSKNGGLWGGQVDGNTTRTEGLASDWGGANLTSVSQIKRDRRPEMHIGKRGGGCPQAMRKGVSKGGRFFAANAAHVVKLVEGKKKQGRARTSKLRGGLARRGGDKKAGRLGKGRCGGGGPWPKAVFEGPHRVRVARGGSRQGAERRSDAKGKNSVEL